MSCDPHTRDAIGLRKTIAELGFAEPEADAAAIDAYFAARGRPPTELELQVLAQSWSEHCKHRVFHARIEHLRHLEDGSTVTDDIDGLLDSFVRDVTEEVNAKKPDFVLSAFDDNAGFIRLDGDTAVCMKVETHNHPSALAPFQGAATGMGGVIRDILGAGKGAEPIASVDVFCLGPPEFDDDRLPPSVLPPRDVLRGVVRGVGHYGNRMGIPTVAGALKFDERYTCNPLVFCGTLGILPADDVEKSVEPGLAIAVAGAPTRRIGMGGATFASTALSPDSHCDDRQALQIGDPFAERTLADFVLAARRAGLVRSITDCGAGGLSCAVGEIVAPCGGAIDLECVPLGEEGLTPREIFLSESQERMVLAIAPDDIDEARELARRYQTTFAVVGRFTDSGHLRVRHDGRLLCDLETTFLHSPPRRRLRSVHEEGRQGPIAINSPDDPEQELRELLASPDHCSREPVIRQYDFEVRGDTLLKPLAGASGDAPQGAVGLRAGGGDTALTVALGICPRRGDEDAREMGWLCVDRALRKSVAAGADPDRVALLDNFSVGDPDDARELGRLVECVRGMSDAARAFELPFISGKDSFYNFFTLPDGSKRSIPTTLVVSAVGVAAHRAHLTGASLVADDSRIFATFTPAADTDTASAVYGAIHRCVAAGHVRSARAVCDGGVAVAAAEMAFSMVAGLELDLASFPDDLSTLFADRGSGVLLEAAPGDLDDVRRHFDDLPFASVGHTTADHRRLRLNSGGDTLIDLPLSDLKRPWTDALSPYC